MHSVKQMVSMLCCRLNVTQEASSLYYILAVQIDNLVYVTVCYTSHNNMSHVSQMKELGLGAVCSPDCISDICFWTIIYSRTYI